MKTKVARRPQRKTKMHPPKINAKPTKTSRQIRKKPEVKNQRGRFWVEIVKDNPIDGGIEVVLNEKGETISKMFYWLFQATEMAKKIYDLGGYCRIREDKTNKLIFDPHAHEWELKKRLNGTTFWCVVERVTKRNSGRFIPGEMPAPKKGMDGFAILEFIKKISAGENVILPPIELVQRKRLKKEDYEGILKEKGRLSPRQLAEKYGCSSATICRIHSGKQKWKEKPKERHITFEEFMTGVIKEPEKVEEVIQEKIVCPSGIYIKRSN